MEIRGYQLDQQLPGGRFGARWRGTGPHGEAVALKQLARLEATSADAVLDGLACFRAVADPHLARGDEPVPDAAGCVWLVEEWVEGVSLGALAKERTLSTGQALGVARGVLGGLAALHSAGLAHGLVSPATVMLDMAGQPRLIDAGSWLADPDVAATDGFAAPEVLAGEAPGSASDVFSAGRLVSESLAAGPVDAGLAAVLATATADDPRARQQDAGALLAQLSHAAERAYGPVWWTLEGVGGAVASAVGSGAAGAVATTGAATSGSSGVVPGSLGVGSAALVAGAETGSGGAGLVREVAKGSNPLRKLIPVVVGVVVVVVAGLAVASNSGPQSGTLAVPAGSTTPSASVSPSATATPTPTPTPPLALGFNGTYTYVSVRTKSNDPRFPVGEKQTSTWKVTTTCVGQDCTTIAEANGSPVPMTLTDSGWVSDLTFPVDCVEFDTQKKIGRVDFRLVRKLKVVSVADGHVTKLRGTSKARQLKACKIQTVPVGKYEYKVTMTLDG